MIHVIRILLISCEIYFNIYITFVSLCTIASRHVVRLIDLQLAVKTSIHNNIYNREKNKYPYSSFATMKSPFHPTSIDSSHIIKYKHHSTLNRH